MDMDLIDLAVISPPTTLPVQTGPIYHCFDCGQLVTSLMTWQQAPKLCGPSQLDDWGEHIAYLTTGCACAPETRRVAKLGDCLTPLRFPKRQAFANFREFEDAEIAALQAALAVIAQAVPEDARTCDAPTRITWQLLTGALPPAAAIAQIRALARGAA